MPNEVATKILERVGNGNSNLYWVTVGRELQQNYMAALGKGVWGVKDVYRGKLRDVRTEDYILFYGTGAGGWYYSDVENDFIHNQHPYDTKNYLDLA